MTALAAAAHAGPNASGWVVIILLVLALGAGLALATTEQEAAMTTMRRPDPGHPRPPHRVAGDGNHPRHRRRHRDPLG